MSIRTHQRPYHHGSLAEALLEAAEASLRAHGVSQLSLRDLAREVGVSHAAPRRHFPERQDLLDALAERGFTRLGEKLRQALDSSEEFRDRVQAAVSAFAHFAIENPTLLELMNATKHHSKTSSVTRASELAFAPVVELIELGQTQSMLRAGSPGDLGLILYATISGITTMINSGAIPAARLDVLTEAVVEHFLRGAA